MDNEKRVYAYTRSGEYAGYVRLDTDETGEPVGEVYSPKADKLGAIRYAPLANEAQMSLVHDPDGTEIGYVQLNQEGEGETWSASIYWQGRAGTENETIAQVLWEPGGMQQAEVRKKGAWGEEIGSLKPENVSDEELVLIGGGAALLILL